MRRVRSIALSVAVCMLNVAYGINLKLLEREADGIAHGIFEGRHYTDHTLEESLELPLVDKGEVKSVSEGCFEALISQTNSLIGRNFEVGDFFEEFCDVCQRAYKASQDDTIRQFIVYQLLQRVTDKVDKTVKKIEKVENCKRIRVEHSHRRAGRKCNIFYIKNRQSY